MSNERLASTCFVFALSCMAIASAHAQEAELDALNLESAPESATAAPPNSKLFFEGALGDVSQRFQSGHRNLGRLSVDLSYQKRLTSGVRAVFSDRLDHFDPALAGTDDTVNSLREAYVSWQADGGNLFLELGRINLRYGPSYGYNPTDFFRDGSLRVFTTADPIALRENRMGTVMIRGQHMWAGNAVSLALSPKLNNAVTADGWNVNLGATNNRDRAVLTFSTPFSKNASGQALLYKQGGQSTAVGFNATALLSDAATAHMEFTRSKEPGLVDRSLGARNASEPRNRVSAGITYTTLGKLSLTAEYQYNGFAPSRADWLALGGTPAAQLAYLSEALRMQELAVRQSYLIYVTQKSFFHKDVDLTTYLQTNSGDNSRLFWAELRRHWPNFDLSLQWQQNIGKANSEFGVLPDRRVVQVLGTYYH